VPATAATASKILIAPTQNRVDLMTAASVRFYELFLDFTLLGSTFAGRGLIVSTCI
jgi:hypothetical protein